ncbi:MAG: alkaline phosphatase family protein, partial [Clostridia bacterium]|nr:alkaline phosphatase family protein [Clostridia bacterium]
MEKVILISIDGMRPDGFTGCSHPFARTMMELGSYTLDARTVLPSVTLPCHMSMFHSVPPERHGVTTNIYMPMARPLNGLFEQIRLLGGVSAMYYGWEPLRDVSRPESLKYAGFMNAYMEDHTDAILTDMALERIGKSRPDFVFLYMVETDEKGGHASGWTDPDPDLARRHPQGPALCREVRRHHDAGDPLPHPAHRPDDHGLCGVHREG